MKTQAIAGTARLALVLILILISGWYFSKLLGVLTSLLIFLLTVFATSYFICAVYDVPSRIDAFQFMLMFILGLNYPVIKISEGRVDEKSRGTPGFKLGGPGVIKVSEDSAALLARGKEFKVIGPGTYVAGRGEKVKEAVDLRPQKRTGEVRAMTKDGIEVTVDFAVGFQIHTGGREPTPEEPYPFAEQAVQRAVYRGKQVSKEGAQTWHERIPGFVSAPLQEIIATHYLDALFEPDKSWSDPRADFMDELKRKAQRPAGEIGVQINWVHFDTPKIPDQAAHKYVEHYVSKLQSKIKEIEALAQREALTILVKAFDQMEWADDKLNHLLRVRFVEALEAISKEKKTSTVVLPYEALETLRTVTGESPKGEIKILPPDTEP